MLLLNIHTNIYFIVLSKQITTLSTNWSLVAYSFHATLTDCSVVSPMNIPYPLEVVRGWCCRRKSIHPYTDLPHCLAMSFFMYPLLMELNVALPLNQTKSQYASALLICFVYISKMVQNSSTMLSRHCRLVLWWFCVSTIGHIVWCCFYDSCIFVSFVSN